MSFEILVGLDVTDDVRYAEYRAAMKPILTEYGGGFGYDFRVAEVLKTESVVAINRVFTIRFPDRAAKEAFFADPAYVVAKEHHFEASVGGTQIIAEYDTAAS